MGGTPQISETGPAKVVPVRLTPELLGGLDELAARRKVTRSELVRAAIGEYLDDAGEVAATA